MFSISEIKNEILNELRNSNIIDITIREVDTISETFTADEEQLIFLLQNEGVKNVRSVKVNGEDLKYYEDFLLFQIRENEEFIYQVHIFKDLEANDSVEIEYDYSTKGDKIYPDYPNLNINKNSYPRVGFEIVSERVEDRTLNGTLTKNNLLLEVVIKDTNKKNLEQIEQNIKDFFNNNKKTFYTMNYIKRTGTSNLDLVDDKNLIYQKILTYEIPFEFET